MEKVQLSQINIETKDNCAMYYTDDGIIIENNDNECKSFSLFTTQSPDLPVAFLNVSFFGGVLRNAGGYITVDNTTLTLNSNTSIRCSSQVQHHWALCVNARSSIVISNISYEYAEREKNLDDSFEKKDVIVITPDYPTNSNLYRCAFAHTRCVKYLEAGLNILVVSCNQNNYYQSMYTYEGVQVYQCRIIDLKRILKRKISKVIVTHFVDVYYYQIFDSCITDEKLIFICHGPETTYRFLPKVSAPYFCDVNKITVDENYFKLKDFYVQKYSKKERVQWIFVSEWLKNFSEELQQLKFKNCMVIHNVIDEQKFTYNKKTEEDRKKILVLRKFDNIRYHSIDQVVLAILELSRRPFFKDLEIDVYGDGDYYDTLVEPIRGFDNVHLYRTFIPNSQIYKLYEDHGILLIPSRHDAHAVSMSEAASSGMVVVGSDVTSNPYFMDEPLNHTLADPENPFELADIISRLYENPKEFLEISERMSKETQERCGTKNTIDREIEHIKKSFRKEEEVAFTSTHTSLDTNETNNPLLTIVIPAYNVEQYIEKTLYSLICTKNLSKLDILVVNDGSKDGTSKIAHSFADKYPKVVRVIDKENGGHGSAINAGLANAKGRYLRLLDGDDWFDSDEFDTFVDKLEGETADLILTNGSYDYVDKAEFVNIIDYDMLHDGSLYYFDDLMNEGYGFVNYGNLLSTSTYKTECLKKARFKISEHMPYVDMEYNAFAIKCIVTVRYYNLNIYRYFIGREGQTVSRTFALLNCEKHKTIIFSILNNLYNDEEYPVKRKQYVYKRIIAQMVDLQVFLYDQVEKREELKAFIEKLKWDYPDAFECAVDYIYKKNAESKGILKLINTSSLVNNTRDSKVDRLSENREKTFKQYILKCFKAITPYGIVWLRRKYINR